jgi:hypothetical protein
MIEIKKITDGKGVDLILEMLANINLRMWYFIYKLFIYILC